MAGSGVAEELRVKTTADRHVIETKAKHGKENVSAVVLLMPEETVQHMERNAENVGK